MLKIIVGAALGFLSGLGVGGGSLLLLWLTLVMGTDRDTARAMNLLFFLPCALTATAFSGCVSMNQEVILPANQGQLTPDIFDPMDETDDRLQDIVNGKA